MKPFVSKESYFRKNNNFEVFAAAQISFTRQKLRTQQLQLELVLFGPNLVQSQRDIEKIKQNEGSRVPDFGEDLTFSLTESDDHSIPLSDFEETSSDLMGDFNGHFHFSSSSSNKNPRIPPQTHSQMLRQQKSNRGKIFRSMVSPMKNTNKCVLISLQISAAKISIAAYWDFGVFAFLFASSFFYHIF